MFKDILHTAFEDMFEHLGVGIQYQPRGNAVMSIVAVVKNPENLYIAGESDVVGQSASVTVRAHEITPRIGDVLILDSKKYKIFKEPLLDASNYMWKFEAILI